MFYFPFSEILEFLGMVRSEHPLRAQSSFEERFVSGLMLKSPHCVSCTVICGCVLSGHRVQLQEELVLGCVSGDGDAALEGWVVASATSITYVPHPLQLLPWELLDPGPPVTTGDGVIWILMFSFFRTPQACFL